LPLHMILVLLRKLEYVFKSIVMAVNHTTTDSSAPVRLRSGILQRMPGPFAGRGTAVTPSMDEQPPSRWCFPKRGRSSFRVGVSILWEALNFLRFAQDYGRFFAPDRVLWSCL
jgi:hypothetical protein